MPAVIASLTVGGGLLSIGPAWVRSVKLTPPARIPRVNAKLQNEAKPGGHATRPGGLGIPSMHVQSSERACPRNPSKDSPAADAANAEQERRAHRVGCRDEH